VISAILVIRRFVAALRVALREEDFTRVLAAALLLVVVGTITYTLGAGWSVTDSFYVAVATLTTSSFLNPNLTITDGWLEIFSAFSPPARRWRRPGRPGTPPIRPTRSTTAMREVLTGVWHWACGTGRRPDWKPGEGRGELVSSYAIDDGERPLLFDPLAPPAGIEELAAIRETAIVLTCPWHARGGRATGPSADPRAASRRST
jgi:hypothetical protein